MIKLFADTEFTGFLPGTSKLISIGLYTADGRGFYAESADFALRDCSEFVEHVVIPLLDAAQPSRPWAVTIRGTEREIAGAMRAWIENLGGLVEILTDCVFYDGAFLDHLLSMAGGHPANLTGHREIHVEPIHAGEWHTTLRRHHALDDAIALCRAYSERPRFG